jgi:hypothetical protein
LAFIPTVGRAVDAAIVPAQHAVEPAFDGAERAAQQYAVEPAKCRSVGSAFVSSIHAAIVAAQQTIQPTFDAA